MSLFRSGCTFALVILSLTFGWRSPASGQSLTRGSVSGVVRDPTGTALSGTSVILRDLSSGNSQAATTLRDGRFRFFLLLPGEYELLAERFGSGPRRLRGISVRPGRRLDLAVDLVPVGAAVAGADTARYVTLSRGELGTAGGRHFARETLRGLPEEERELSSLARLSSASGPGFAVQGLPGYLSTVMVDGIPVTLPRTAVPTGTMFGATHLALSGFEGAELAIGGLDVELPGQSGGILSGYTRRGTPDVRVEGFATAGTGTVSGWGPFEGATESPREAIASLVVSGPIEEEVASFALGVEGWVGDRDPAGEELSDSLAAAVTAAAAANGVNLPPLGRPDRRTGALSGFARLDWQVAEQHSVSVRSNFALFSNAPDSLGAAPSSLADTRFDGGQLSAGAEVISILGDGLTQSIRLGFELIDREYRPGQQLPLADTRILADDWRYSLGSSETGELREAVLRASETLNLDTDRHALKAGLAVAVTGYDHTFARGRSGEFLFSSLDDFASGAGAFAQSLGPATQADFTLPQLSSYLQDEWRAAPGLELLAGVRYDLEALPTNDAVRNLEWIARSGLDPRDDPSLVHRFSPRVGLRWDPAGEGAWLLTGSFGLFSQSVDPALLAEVLAEGSAVTIRRGLASASSWPALPDSSDAPVLGPRLVLLAPAFGGPRTVRGGIGISRALWQGATLGVSADYRRTDVLPRARDLNLSPAAIGQDQHGRPVYGRLGQAGGLLLPESGSNRRFAGFDQVLATDVDGWSTFGGVTVTAEQRGAGDFHLTGSYTYSRTRDNWPLGPLGGSELPAFPEDGEGDDWAEGTGDLDVPHRAVVTATTAMPGFRWLRLGAVYRYRSGYPFTPGFRPGVDANGDGSAGNDPAFVDPALPGMEGLLAAWSCLSRAAGGFAERNSCRGPDAHTLDFRASLQIARAGRYSVRIQADGLNLLDSSTFAVDGALYRVDPARTLAIDPATGVVTVPLLVNDRFGESLRPIEGGRAFRFGLRLDY